MTYDELILRRVGSACWSSSTSSGILLTESDLGKSSGGCSTLSGILVKSGCLRRNEYNSLMMMMIYIVYISASLRKILTYFTFV